MKVEIIANNKEITAKINGEIDHHSTIEIRQTIDKAIDRAHPHLLILDFKGVTFSDSSGIAVVIGRWKKMKSIGGITEIININNQIKKIFVLSGVTKFVKIKDV
ncbi:MAG: anti-sigma factor antagonist [Clostridia bacterium]